MLLHNSKHCSIVREGSAAIAAWRAEHPNESLRLNGMDFRECDLEGADLRGADLRSADLRGANLGGAHLCDADLTNARLDGARLLKADLAGANLTNARGLTADQLSGTEGLIHAQLDGGRYSDAMIARHLKPLLSKIEQAMTAILFIRTKLS